eukprot:gnl/Dysnectes_brevis/5232_a7431_603.p1 GENE.gnl/Dysnectes_brevis/5232_a7431_603~~gnl/Dysnectes_brevis/5232_a7431_603.p1  ORF type:complete len:626 (-),score=229.63 gnl/Dysnectes_brevis/5232_a7431_603:147-1907(-)
MGTVTISKIAESSAASKFSSQSRKSNPPRLFTFDSTYGPDSKQEEIFVEAVRPLIDAVVDGYNATIFAYGQTGSGKTFTMSGAPDNPGMIPHAFQHIFDHISRAGDAFTYLVRASFLEIYNEEVRDLITGTEKLQLKQHPDRGIYVDGLSGHTVSNESEIHALMARGNDARVVAATKMNAHSSRSHSTFQVTVECSEIIGGKETIRVGKLNLVDLAGSERQERTGATGQRLKEAAKINLSLTTLGQVISKLVKKSTHVPYRDSKLTRLLEDSLGGNAKTLMIANISPASSSCEESISTLKYADRAKQIKNKPKVNEDPKDAMLRQMREQIKALEDKLAMAKQTQSLRSRQLDQSKQQAAGMTQGGSGSSAGRSASGSGGDRGTKPHNVRDRERLEREIAKREDAALKAQQESDQMADQLAAMQAKLLDKSHLESEARKSAAELRQAKIELAERRRREQMLKRRLRKEQEQKEQYETEFATLQDALVAKRRTLKRLSGRMSELEEDVAELEAAQEREKGDLQGDLQELTRLLKLRTLVVDSFVPRQLLTMLEQASAYDEDQQQWFIPHSELAGNVIRTRQAFFTGVY